MGIHFIMGEGESGRKGHLNKAYKVSVAAFIFTSLAAVEAMFVRDPTLVRLVIAPSFEEFTKFAGISLLAVYWLQGRTRATYLLIGFSYGCVFGLFELVEYTGRLGVEVIPLRLVAMAMHATTASVIGLSAWSAHRGRMVVAAALFTIAVIYHWTYNTGAVTGNITLYACMALLSVSVAVAVVVVRYRQRLIGPLLAP